MKINKNYSTTPLTERGYLLTNSFSRVGRTYDFEGPEPYSPVLLYIASVLYLYGADFRGIYSGYSGKIPKGKEDVLGYNREPLIYFTYKNQPLVNNFKNIKIIKNELNKLGHDMWYPFLNWLTPEGVEVRSMIEPKLDYITLTQEAEAWEKEYKKFRKIVGFWFDDFVKKSKNKNKLKFKAQEFKKTSLLCFRFRDDDFKKLKSISEIKNKQKEYISFLDDFAAYLYDGFLNKRKGFHKCKFEI